MQVTGMKRLSMVNYELAGLVNSSVLNHYNIKCNPKYDLKDIPPIVAYAIQQALKHAVKQKFNTANEHEIDEYIYIVTRLIMKFPYEAMSSLQADNGDWHRWRDVVQSERRSLIDLHSSYGLPPAPQQIIVTEHLVQKMEEIYFAEPDGVIERASE